MNKRSDVRFLWGMLVLTRPVSAGFGTYVGMCVLSSCCSWVYGILKCMGASNASAKDMRGNIVVYGALSHSNYKNIEYPVIYCVHLLPPVQQQRIISLVRSLSP